MIKGKVLLFALLLVFATSVTAGEVNDCLSTVSLSVTPMHLLVCPAGDFQDMGDDAGSYIIITVRDGVGAGIPSIPTSDYWLDACDAGQALYLCAGGVAADSMTNALGQTTISDAMSAGGCILTQGVYVAVQNVTIVQSPACTDPVCLDIVVKSPDLSTDGVVGLADFGIFQTSYGSSAGGPLYNECCDYKDDDVIGLSDFGYFTAHYNHECQ